MCRVGRVGKTWLPMARRKTDHSGEGRSQLGMLSGRSPNGIWWLHSEATSRWQYFRTRRLGLVQRGDSGLMHNRLGCQHLVESSLDYH